MQSRGPKSSAKGSNLKEDDRAEAESGSGPTVGKCAVRQGQNHRQARLVGGVGNIPHIPGVAQPPGLLPTISTQIYM